MLIDFRDLRSLAGELLYWAGWDAAFYLRDAEIFGFHEKVSFLPPKEGQTGPFSHEFHVHDSDPMKEERIQTILLAAIVALLVILAFRAPQPAVQRFSTSVTGAALDTQTGKMCMTLKKAGSKEDVGVPYCEDLAKE